MVDNMGTYGGWFHGFGGIFMVLFWVLVIAGIAVLVKWLLNENKRSVSTPASNAALDILNERYARGEIDHDEYEQKKNDLLQ